MPKLFYLCSFLFLISCSATLQNQTAANFNAQLGLTYLQQHDLANAKQKLLLALQQAPKSLAVQEALAYFFERTGDPIAAQHYYLQGIKLAPYSGIAQNNYGTFLCRQGDYWQALQYFMRAAQDVNYLNPAHVYENAGLCALKIPDKSEARGLFQKALTIDPQSATALFELSKLSYNQRR